MYLICIIHCNSCLKDAASVYTTFVVTTIPECWLLMWSNLNNEDVVKNFEGGFCSWSPEGSTTFCSSLHAQNVNTWLRHKCRWRREWNIHLFFMSTCCWFWLTLCTVELLGMLNLILKQPECSFKWALKLVSYHVVNNKVEDISLRRIFRRNLS